MQRFQNILVLIQDGHATEALRARAAWLAQGNGARLTLAHCLADTEGELSRLLALLPGNSGAQARSDLDAQKRAELEAVAAPLRAEGHDVQVVLLAGTPFIETIRHVLTHEIDLVLTEARHSPASPFFRSNEMHLLRKCPCPVWILNASSAAKSDCIVAAVDPAPFDAPRDALNRQVLEMATSLAAQDGARVDVLHAWHLPEERTLRSALVNAPDHNIDALLEHAHRLSAERLDALIAAHGTDMPPDRVIHVKGQPSDMILQHVEAESADTLVMGTVGRTGIAGFFIGNTAETVLSRARCSVLAVKPKGFVSPVTLDPQEDRNGN